MIAEKRELFFSCVSGSHSGCTGLHRHSQLALQAALLVDTHAESLVLSDNHRKTGQVIPCMVLHQLSLL